MRRVWLWTILVVLASSGAAQAVSVGLRDAATGSSTVQTTGPGDTVVLELYLDTEGLSFEGYYLGVDFTGGPLTIQSVAHQPLGLFPDLFGAPVIDGGAQTVRDINQTTFVSPLAAGEYVLDLITVQIGALAVGAVSTATPGLVGQVIGAGGGSCPGTVEGCSVSVSSALIIVPEPGTGLLLAASLLLLTLHRPEPSL